MALGGGSMAQRNEGMAPRHAKTPRPNTDLCNPGQGELFVLLDVPTIHYLVGGYKCLRVKRELVLSR